MPFDVRERKRSGAGRDYLSLKLDDASFNAPIYANLFEDEDGEGYRLIWPRGRKPASELAEPAGDTPPGLSGGVRCMNRPKRQPVAFVAG